MNSSETPQTPSAPATATPASPDANAANAANSGSPQNSAESSPSANTDAAAPAEATADHAAAPSAPASASDAGDASGDEGPDDGDEGETQAADGATTPGAAPGTPGADGKKKRRRRRRKKHGAVAADGSTTGEATANGGEVAASEAMPGDAKPGDATAATSGKPGDGKKKDKRKDKAREHHHRERPAFAVGDVVFGKILEVNDDSIVIDVAGKARAVFDKLELLLPEDVADTIDEENRKAEAAAEALLRSERNENDKKAGDATEATEAPSAEAAEAAHAHHDAPIETGDDHEAAVVAAEAAAVQENAESASAEADSHAAEAAGEGGEAKPGVIQLPRVVLEAGAPFVGVVHNDGGRGGLIVLTHHPKRGGKAKPAVAGAFKNKSEIFGLVTGVIKGGVEVDVDGLRAFAPGSHMSLHLGADLTPFVGKRLPFFVTQYAKRGRDIVLSRKAKLEVEAKAAREAALSRVKPGDKIEGTVRSVVPFGAFVDIGGVEGLVSLSEMSHNRSDSPSDVFKVGQKTEVIVQRVDERGKIWLSHKATIADPWAEVATKYALGTRHSGKIVRIQPFGAFVELESGVDGLIHVADFFGIKDPVTGQLRLIENPSEVVKVGDEIEVVVSQLDTSSHKIALHPALLGDQANEESQKVQMGKMLKVVVVGVESAGLLVRILGATGRSARGYITAAATNTPRGTELRKPFPIGTQLEAKVLEIDPRRGEAKLSVKALQQDTERNAYQQYRQQVKREAKFGTFGDLLAQNLAKKNPTK